MAVAQRRYGERVAADDHSQHENMQLANPHAIRLHIKKSEGRLNAKWYHL
jgi:hypothetical protein